jgi:hypothetical protein
MIERRGLRGATGLALTPAKTGAQVRKMQGSRPSASSGQAFRGNDVREEG